MESKKKQSFCMTKLENPFLAEENLLFMEEYLNGCPRNE